MPPSVATQDCEHEVDIRSSGRDTRVSNKSESALLPSATLGRAIGITDNGSPLIDFPGNPRPDPLTARSTCDFQSMDIGAEVLLVFTDGDYRQPVVIGVLDRPRTGRSDDNAVQADDVESSQTDNHEIAPIENFEIERDGERVVISADDEIVLKCGKASITLTRAGKILLRGTYLLNRSSGANRIKGSSVQIN